MKRLSASEIEAGTLRDAPMPRAVKLWLGGAIGALLLGGIALALVRGPAILIDLAGSMAAFFCL